MLAGDVPVLRPVLPPAPPAARPLVEAVPHQVTPQDSVLCSSAAVQAADGSVCDLLSSRLAASLHRVRLSTGDKSNRIQILKY